MIKESVWDYPRPAICRSFSGKLKIIHNNKSIASTSNAYRILETSHPPCYYLPQQDIDMKKLTNNGHNSFCEWKGIAHYFDLIDGKTVIKNVAWSYTSPSPAFDYIRGYLSFYSSKFEACFVNEEKVQDQQGDFYGGWITSNLIGPFKGEPGTDKW